jgi:homocysteine S-methyltransferase
MGEGHQALSFAAALSEGSAIILDGALGTELTRLGRRIGSKDWVSSTLGSPEDVSRIHRAYAEAGAQIHIANTFATARYVLADVGLESQFERINREAIRICRNAISGVGPEPSWVAGSISTYVVGSDRANLPRGPQLEAFVREHAALLADAGCDLIVLEMLFDVETSILMMKAARAARLPISIGLTCIRDDAGDVFLRGEYTGRPDYKVRLIDALPQIVSATSADHPWIVTIMHSDLEVTDDAVDIVRRTWSGPLGAYPNTGHLVPPDDWDYASVCETDVFLSYARSWVGRGVKIIGGCCGVGPAHIAALASEWGVKPPRRTEPSSEAEF